MKDYEEWEKKKEEVEDYCGLSSLEIMEILIVVPNKGKTNQPNKPVYTCGSYLLLVTEQLGREWEDEEPQWWNTVALWKCTDPKGMSGKKSFQWEPLNGRAHSENESRIQS